MKSAVRSLLVFCAFGIFCSLHSQAQVVENNSSSPLNFTVVIGTGGDARCTSAGTYQFSLPPHTSRTWSDGVIISSAVNDGESSYTVRPGDHIVAPLYGTLKDIECSTLKKTVWDHETF